MDLNGKTTIMTNFGYLIKKSEWTEDFLTLVRNDLTVKPEIDKNYNGKEEEPFPIFQEGLNKILLPKYYGIEKFGNPTHIMIDTNVYQRTNLKFNGILRDYQVPIIEKCIRSFVDGNNRLLPYGGGVITVPPGKGKTCMGIYIGCLIGLKMLIIVHKTFLVNQWIERIQQYAPAARIGIIQQDKIDIENKDIVIGMLQSISKKEYDEDIFEGFPLVIFDEVHHLGAKVFSKALLKIQAPYTIGLSATPERKDKLEKVFYWHLGKSIYYEGADIDSSVNIKLYKFSLSKPDKLFKEIFSPWSKTMNMSKMVTNLTEIKIRLYFIIYILTEIFPVTPYDPKDRININHITRDNIAYRRSLFGNVVTFDGETTKTYRKVLLLSNRVNHLKEIATLMIRIDPRWEKLIGFYIGGMKERKLKESEGKTLILATFEMASEGLDIKNLDTLILATPKSSITQSIGRILRTQANQRTYVPVVYDIVDNISVFLSQGKKRYADYYTKKYNVRWFNVIDTCIEPSQPFLNYVPNNINTNDFIDDNNDPFIDE